MGSVCVHVGGKTKAFCPCEDMNSPGYLQASGLFSSCHKRALITDVSIAVNLGFFAVGPAEVEEVGDFGKQGLRN